MLRKNAIWKKYHQQRMKQKRMEQCKRRAKKGLLIGVGALGAVHLLAMTGMFMPRNSSDQQELSVKTLKQTKNKRIRRVLINAHDGLQLHATIFEAKKPVGLVQVIHGALEHKGRYYPLMRYLAEHGYTCIIIDNRGHGFSIDSRYPLGYMNGVDQIMDDQHRVTRYIKSQHPNLPLTIIGHSLGSMFARNYLQNHDKEIDKMVLSGTPYFNCFTRLGIYWGRALMFFLGHKNTNRIFNNIPRDKDWLSNNQENIQKAEQDPLMFDQYKNAAGYTIWEANWNLKQYKKYQCQNPQLKILNMVGEEDQKITGGTEGVEDSLNTLRKAGYENIQNLVYPKMKHEIFNENHKEVVYKDLLNFLNK